MKILFWNVQRLGASTPDSCSTIMEGVMAEAFKLHGAEFALMCEITSNTSLGEVEVTK